MFSATSRPKSALLLHPVNYSPFAYASGHERSDVQISKKIRYRDELDGSVQLFAKALENVVEETFIRQVSFFVVVQIREFKLITPYFSARSFTSPSSCARTFNDDNTVANITIAIFLEFIIILNETKKRDEKKIAARTTTNKRRWCTCFITKTERSILLELLSPSLEDVRV